MTSCRQGKARYVGVSNFRLAQLEACMKLRRIDVVQYGWNMFDRRMQREIFPWCTAQGVGVMAYGSLAYGMLSGAFHADMQFDETDWRSKRGALGAINLFRTMFGPDHFPRNLRAVEELKALAAKYGKTLPQFALRWTLSQQRDPHRPRRLPPSGRGGGKSRRARLLDHAGGHGRDRRDLRPQRRRHRTARLAGGRSSRLRPSTKQSTEETPCRSSVSPP